MARTKSNGTNTSTATIGFEAGKESSPELQLARAVAGFDFVHLRFAPVVPANGPANAISSNKSDTALRGSAFLQTGGTLQVTAERQDNFRKDDDVRWQFGVPPKGNANFAWVQHFIHHLAPHGMAGFVLANGSMSSNQRCCHG